MIKKAIFILILSLNANAIKSINYHGIFTNSPVNIRSGPDYFYKILFSTEKEDINIPFMIKYQSGDWYFIETYHKQGGWVKSGLVRKNKNKCILKRNVDVFFRPTLKATQNIKIDFLKKGSVMDCKAYGDFIKVKLSFYKNGWIKKSDTWGL